MNRLSDKEKIIDTIVQMRINYGKSNKELVDFLKSEYGFEQSNCYNYLRWMREKIAEYYSEQNNLKEETIAQYEAIMSKLYDNKNWKLWNEYAKELNKIKQIAVEKQQIELNAKVQGIDIKIITDRTQDDN